MGKSQTHIGLPRWGMVSAHLGVAVALAGAAAESGFSQERLATMAAGDSIEMSGYRFTLQAVNPTAGANWTAIEGEFAMVRIGAEGKDANDSTGAGHATNATILRPQSRSYPRWSAAETSLASGAPTVTNEAALWTNLGGQFYIVISAPMAGDPPQYYRVRLWWKPLVWWIWLGGVMIALGGLLALVGRSQLSLRSLLRRRDNPPHGEQRIAGTLAPGEAT